MVFIRSIVTVLISFLIFSCASTKEESTTYVTQILEPTGGKLVKPRDWHYLEQHKAANSLYWIVSKEDPTTGYDTGLAIQLMLGIKEGTGLSPEEFAKKGIEQKISSSSKVVDLCQQEEVGYFSRICLKVEEKQNRNGLPVTFTVLYSFLWSNSMNSVAITIAGAPAEEWNKHSDTFNMMNQIEIIDPERFNKEQ